MASFWGMESLEGYVSGTSICFLLCDDLCVNDLLWGLVRLGLLLELW